MKCTTCKSSYYPVVNDTVSDGQRKYHVSNCPICDSENFELVDKIGHKHRNGHFNKAIVRDRIAELVYIVLASGVSCYIFSHLDQFCTTR
jgi:hypothetical protein